MAHILSMVTRLCSFTAALAMSCVYPTMEVLPEASDEGQSLGGTGHRSSGDSRGGATADSGGSPSTTDSGGSPSTADSGGSPSTAGTRNTKSYGIEMGGSPATSFNAGGGAGGVTLSGGSAGAIMGGAQSTSRRLGTGCRGSYEEFQDATGLCVAKMATITGNPAATDYRIDVTEVTQGQYQNWLDTEPQLTDTIDPLCGWNRDFEREWWCKTDHRVCNSRPDCGQNAVVCVDWCDAFTYCAAVGKRLCGHIGAQALFPTEELDASRSQWFCACSAGGANNYPYGDEYEPLSCNGQAYWEGTYPETTVPVGPPRTAACTSVAIGYAGVYDLSGGVAEWEDNCDPNSVSYHEDDTCHPRGGAFDGRVDATDSVDDLKCAAVMQATRNHTVYNIGFRCCSQ